eukprot:s2088_g7.t1
MHQYSILFPFRLDANAHPVPIPMAAPPGWFGAAVSDATAKSPELPAFPFPAALAKVVDEHVSKAVAARTHALQGIREATGAEVYDETLKRFQSMTLEADFEFDTGSYPLREDLLESCGFPKDTDLTRLHLHPGAKDLLLRRLTERAESGAFHGAFDRFVRCVCAEALARRAAEAWPGLDCIYYQAFPCLRVVQPGEFSIGPHADVAYGHHPCSMNFYVPLTPISKTSSLFLESRPGEADWHPIVGDYGQVKHFAGALCVHWTTENNTEWTRASLDVRLICGPTFHALKFADGTQDLRVKPGYYLQCFPGSDGCWQRHNGQPLPRPDARFGFPWTVKDWDKRQRKAVEKILNQKRETKELG